MPLKDETVITAEILLDLKCINFLNKTWNYPPE